LNKNWLFQFFCARKTKTKKQNTDFEHRSKATAIAELLILLREGKNRQKTKIQVIIIKTKQNSNNNMRIVKQRQTSREEEGFVSPPWFVICEPLRVNSCRESCISNLQSLKVLAKSSKLTRDNFLKHGCSFRAIWKIVASLIWSF